MKVYALFAVYPDRKELVAVFAQRETAVNFATICQVDSWHIQEVPYIKRPLYPYKSK